MSQYKPTFEDRLARIHQTSAITPRCAKRRPGQSFDGIAHTTWRARQSEMLIKALVDASRSVRTCLMSL